MRDFVDRWLVQLVVGLGLLALGAVAMAAAGIALSGSARDEAASVRAELESSQEDVEGLRVAMLDFLGRAQGLQEQLDAAGPTISRTLEQAVVGLETFATSTIEIDAAVKDTISVDSEFEIDRIIRVPIELVVPVDETIETTIFVDTPVGIDIPVDVRVPLKVELPVSATVSLPIQETVPVSADIPVELDVPVSLDVASTELGELTASLADGLRSLETLLSEIAGS